MFGRLNPKLCGMLKKKVIVKAKVFSKSLKSSLMSWLRSFIKKCAFTIT
jgi:hypothetical protein